MSAVHARDNAGAGLVFKTHGEAIVTDAGREVAHRTRDADDDGASRSRNVTAKDASKMPWTDWVDARLEDRLAAYSANVVGKALGMKCRDIRDQLEAGDAAIRRDLELLQREFRLLQKEVAVERGLKALREEVDIARAEVPKLPAIAAQFDAEQKQLKAKQARLEHELAATKDKLGKLRVNQSITDYGLRELEKQTTAATKAVASIEMETSTTRFALRNIHPDAAKVLREFASQVVDARDGGAIWGRCLI